MGRARRVWHIARAWIVVPALLLPTLAAAPQQPSTLRIDGLSEPVEILRDRWGVNHIYAANEHDLFFAQGYAAARDRLFQFEMWRRQATGTVAEIFGPGELKRDIGARLHMFRGDLKTELNWYHPRGEEIITSFVRGVNAYVDEAMKTPSSLPTEFKLLGITPGHWTPAVVISRHNALVSNLEEELTIAQAVRAVGAARVKDLEYFQGGDPNITADPAIDLSLINDSILELYKAFRAPIKYGSGSPPTEAEDWDVNPIDIGSNNWVVSGKRTASGYPMMMNDPHRAQGAPSLRYWVHLVAPGWNVIGGGEPVLPGVSIGHNEYGAWGLTIFGSDSEDLYVYETNPANPNQYRYRGAWEDMRVIKETIPVKGDAPASVDLKFTRHGPVLSEDVAHHKAYALRAAWMETGAAPYQFANPAWVLKWTAGGSWYKPNLAGTHNFQFGFEWGKSYNSYIYNVNQGINIILNTDATTGLPSNQVLAYNTPTTQKNYFRDTSFYLQDTWNIKRRLTVDVGLRYDNFRTYYPAQKSDPNETFSQLFPITNFTASGNLVDWNTVSPRIGLAFDPTGKGNSVLRFGFGIYYIMQGTGLVNDHVVSCFRYRQLR